MKNKQRAKILATALYRAAEGKSGQQLQAVLDNFLGYLKRHNSFYLLSDILKALEDIHLVENKIVKVKVQSRYELADELLNSIRDYISQKTGQQVRLETGLNDSLIGGFRARYADKLLDASIKYKLNKLIKQFSS